MSAPRSAYVHIPFCHRRCFYCDFAVVPLGDQASGESGPGSASITAYLEQLHAEIALSPSGPPLATIYVGGGTPSLLSPGQIAQLLNALRVRFGIQPGAEITLEMDPASFDQADLRALIRAGINRVSLGGQSFDDHVLEGLGRRHRCRDLLQCSRWLTQAIQQGALRSWSLDLIRNLPDQDETAWSNQLDLALQTRAPHLSIYDLAVEPGTVFAWRAQRGELPLPDDDLAVALMALTSDRLGRAGFCRYEISNYAQAGHASRHNRVYWSGAGWWGFGMGATSAPWGERLARPRTREGYASWLRGQQTTLDPSLSAHSAQGLPLDDRLLVGLRRREGVHLWDQAQQSGWSHECCTRHLPSLEARWRNAEQQGLILRESGRWRLSDPEGMALSNQLLVELVCWWDSLPAALRDSTAAADSPNL
ncbi:MAG: radical SAM family heme chaperone HemW [Synechococcus sp.]|nr:radical SAM family heme chaperone HemW [Synechococcus sp.]